VAESVSVLSHSISVRDERDEDLVGARLAHGGGGEAAEEKADATTI
jgi:hypothetical protein